MSEQYARPLFPIIDYDYIFENYTGVVEETGEALEQNSDIKAAFFGVWDGDIGEGNDIH